MGPCLWESKRMQLLENVYLQDRTQLGLVNSAACRSVSVKVKRNICVGRDCQGRAWSCGKLRELSSVTAPDAG